MNKKSFDTKTKTTHHERLMDEFAREMGRAFPSLDFSKDGTGDEAKFRSSSVYLMFAAYQAALNGPFAFKPGCYALAQIREGEMYLVGELTTDFKKIVTDQKRLNQETRLLHIILTSTEGSMNFMLSKMTNGEMPKIASLEEAQLQMLEAGGADKSEDDAYLPVNFRQDVASYFDDFVSTMYPEIVFPKNACDVVADTLAFAAALPRSSKQKLVYGCLKRMFEHSLKLDALRTLVFHDDGAVMRNPAAVPLNNLGHQGYANSCPDLAEAIHGYLCNTVLKTSFLQTDCETTAGLLADFFDQTNGEENRLTDEQAKVAFNSILETITGVQIFSHSELSLVASNFIDFISEVNED